MKKLKTVLLSFGMSGRVFHAPFIQAHPGFELVGSWERSHRKIKEHYSSATSFPDLDSILRTDVDLVVVNTPTYTHYNYAKKCMEAGKHVVVEKAFTTTASEAEELIELARAKEVRLSVFQNRRWDSDFQTVRKVLNEGYLGEVIEVTLGFCRYKPEVGAKTHKEAPGPGAGIVKDLGAHVIDQALCLFGMPVSVFADIRTTRQGSQVDDYFDILLRYANKSVHVKGGYFFKGPSPEFAIYGTKGSFLKPRADVQEDQLALGVSTTDPQYGVESTEHQGMLNIEDSHGQTKRERYQTLKGNYMEYYDLLYQAIFSGGPVPVSGEEGLQVMRIIDASFQSSEKGTCINL